MQNIKISIADIKNDFQYILPLLYDLQKQHAKMLPKLFRDVKSYEEFLELMEGAESQEDKIRLIKELDFFLLFKKNDLVIGCAYVQDKIRVADTTFLEAHYLSVVYFIIVSQYRGQGLGEICFSNLKKWALDRGYTQMELSVLHDNKSAVALYEKSGLIKEMLTMTCELK